MIGAKVLKKLRVTFAIQLSIVLVMATACSNNPNGSVSGGGSLQTNENTQSAEIDVYGGPGEEYTKVANISGNMIKKYIKYENHWIEVEYGSERGYVRENDCEGIDINAIPHVVYKASQNVYPYPTVYNAKINYTLFDEAEVYSSPGSSSSKTTIDASESATILCSEDGKYRKYIQVEYVTEEGRRRGYSDSVDLLSLDNPLINYNYVKEKNACIRYGGNEYYSTSGEAVKNSVLGMGWREKKQMTLTHREWDLLQGIGAVVAGGDFNDEAIKATEGKIQLYSVKDRQYQNVSGGVKGFTSAATIVDFILGPVSTFFDNSYKDTVLNIRMDECDGEKRIVMRIDRPFEEPKAGIKTTLSSLIVENDNTALTAIECDRLADERIKQWYPEFDKSKKYSMEIEFSNDFKENPYGYYIVIDKQSDVFMIPIIHPGTSLTIYSADGFVYDATWDLGKSMIKLDDKERDIVLSLLAENGFSVNDSTTKVDPIKEFIDELDVHSYEVSYSWRIRDERFDPYFEWAIGDGIEDHASIGYYRSDFDSDEEDELLVVWWNDSTKFFEIGMYELDSNGTMKLQATLEEFEGDSATDYRQLGNGKLDIAVVGSHDIIVQEAINLYPMIDAVGWQLCRFVYDDDHFIFYGSAIQGGSIVQPESFDDLCYQLHSIDLTAPELAEGVNEANAMDMMATTMLADVIDDARVVTRFTADIDTINGVEDAIRTDIYDGRYEVESSGSDEWIEFPSIGTFKIEQG